MTVSVESIMEKVIAKDPDQKMFHQAAREVLENLMPVLEQHPEYVEAKILERILEPERVLSFRVPWVDDKGEVQVNRGFRVQYNSAIGPYKGGIRFHPSVNLDTMKFLGFEQTLKNGLTTLPMGGAKGGADFDPKGKSANEVMRFCQSFMSELYRYIDPNTDVPAGDIGVGAREIGFLFGMYKKLANEHSGGVFTGKGVKWGGSLVRPEATGFGNVYFTKEMLATKGETLEGKTVAVSGFGNVAWGAVKKATELGAKVVTISGPDGYVYDPDGISTEEKINFMLELRASNNDVVAPYAKKFPNAQFFAKRRPWEQKVDIAFPSATQNELNGDDAKNLIANGCICIGEGANMPCTPEAMEIILESKILYSPGKASNAGGVATSGLEMSQNSLRLSWSREEVDEKLHNIMIEIHRNCYETAKKYGMEGNYVAGANIAGFIKIADAMLAQGVI